MSHKKHAARVAAMLADQAKGIRYYGFKAQTDMQGDSATSSEAKRLFREASRHFALGNYAEGMKAWKAADKAEKSTRRQSNPRPRLGTKKPRRASTATGRAPTKRLVARRRANVKKGYFPNPGEVARAHAVRHDTREKKYLYVQVEQSPDKWLMHAFFPDTSQGMKDAKDFAYWFSGKRGQRTRLIRK